VTRRIPFSAGALALCILASVCALLAPARAVAQTCGDADGSGSVTVTDGVQTLRSAAGLSSSCSAARCDVDGSGSTTVTDGVNVLRKAAGLPAPDSCPGSQSDGVQNAVDSVVPFLAFGFAFASDVSLAGTATVLPAGGGEDSCPNGGSRNKFFLSPSFLRITFSACRYTSPGLGSFQFDRSVFINFFHAQVALAFSVTDLENSRVVDFDGFIDFVPRNGGGFVGNGQGIVLTTPQGNFTLSLDQLTVDGDGHVLSGGGSIEDTSDNFPLQRIDFQVTSPGAGSLTAIFDDGSTSSFVLNLLTGDLTPS
jgi:hypothetical protein